MKKAILILFLLACFQSVNSEDVTIFGAGTVSCGKWTDVRHIPGEHFQLLQFVYGYLSAHNYYTSNRQVTPPDEESVPAFVDLYCRNNPLDAVTSAAAALVDELGGSKASHQWVR